MAHTGPAPESSDLVPLAVRRWVYIAAVILNALAVTAAALDLISAEVLAGILAGLGIISGGLAIGYTPRGR